MKITQKVFAKRLIRLLSFWHIAIDVAIANEICQQILNDASLLSAVLKAHRHKIQLVYKKNALLSKNCIEKIKTMAKVS